MGTPIMRREDGTEWTSPEIERLKAGGIITPGTGTIVSLEGVELAEAKLDQLTDDQRVELFAKYCRYCGDKDPRCYCHRDD